MSKAKSPLTGFSQILDVEKRKDRYKLLCVGSKCPTLRSKKKGVFILWIPKEMILFLNLSSYRCICQIGKQKML